MPRYNNLSSREQYDRAKQQTVEHMNLIKDVVRQLVVDEQVSINASVRKIVDDHALKTGSNAFIYKGHTYTNTTGPTASLRKAPLHPALMPEWESTYADQESLNRDKAMLQQGISVLLRNIHDDQGIRDALPEPLVKILDGGRLLNYARTRPELFSLTSKLHKSQFEKTNELIFFYLSSRLLSE